MNLAKVIGTVVSTVKCEGLEGQRLLIIQPLDHHRQPRGRLEVAVDATQAGPGDIVHTASSREAALALDPWFVPVDSAIVGIVDHVDLVDDAP